MPTSYGTKLLSGRSAMAVSLGSALLASAAAAARPQPPVERVADGVYLFTAGAHRSLFVVTTEGVLATDPQSPERAADYRRAIAGVTDAPLRWILYSHHHADHVSGADALRGDQPVPIIANRRTAAALAAGDFPDTAPPDLTFSRDIALRMGGLTIRALYLGPSETDNNIVVLIPERRVLFAVDNVTVRTLPWRDLAGSDPLEWIDTLRRIERLEFDVLAPGHGEVGSHQNVVELRHYMEDLQSAVASQIASGASLAETQQRVRLPQYSDWLRYEEFLPLNVAGMYRALTARR